MIALHLDPGVAVPLASCAQDAVVEMFGRTLMSKRGGGSSTQHPQPDHEVLTAFGERVRALRIAQGWSGERLAQESSLTISSVSRIERAVQEPLLSTVMLLLDALDVPPNELLTGVPVPPRRHSWPMDAPGAQTLAMVAQRYLNVGPIQ